MAMELDWIDCWFCKMLCERIRPFMNARLGFPSEGIKLPVRGVKVSFFSIEPLPESSLILPSIDALEKRSFSLCFWLIGLPCLGDFCLELLGESVFLTIIVLYSFVLSRGCCPCFWFLLKRRGLLIEARLEVVDTTLESSRVGFWSFSLENWLAAAVIGWGTSEYIIFDFANASSLFISDCLLY